MKINRLKLSVMVISAIILFLTSMDFSGLDSSKLQDRDLSLARVQRMSGKLVFLSCEPVNDYYVAFEIKGFTLGSFSSPDEMTNFVIKNALRIGKKENKEFDGVVVGSGKVDIAIKFK